jgi:hypothetical protein
LLGGEGVVVDADEIVQGRSCPVWLRCA